MNIEDFVTNKDKYIALLGEATYYAILKETYESQILSASERDVETLGASCAQARCCGCKQVEGD